MMLDAELLNLLLAYSPVLVIGILLFPIVMKAVREAFSDEDEIAFMKENRLRNERLQIQAQPWPQEKQSSQDTHPWNKPEVKLFSACPYCGSRIAWPYIGTCAHCGAPLKDIQQ